jgi:Phosphotransferase enzyme family
MMSGKLLNIDQLRIFVNERIMSLDLGTQIRSFEVLGKDADTADSSSAFRVTTDDRVFVLLLSAQAFPNSVQMDVEKAARMKAKLGVLGQHVAVPADTGHFQGLSYALTPYYAPLSNGRLRGRWDKRRIKAPVLSWLHSLAHDHAQPADHLSYEGAFDALQSTVSETSETARLLLKLRPFAETATFKPLNVPMHGDLWLGNILGGDQQSRFKLIDWGGSEYQGYPLYDLTRFALSLSMSKAVFKAEWAKHRRALDCTELDMPLYVLGALGHYAKNRGEFPIDRFREMAERVTRLLIQSIP